MPKFEKTVPSTGHINFERSTSIGASYIFSCSTLGSILIERRPEYYSIQPGPAPRPCKPLRSSIYFRRIERGSSAPLHQKTWRRRRETSKRQEARLMLSYPPPMFPDQFNKPAAGNGTLFEFFAVFSYDQKFLHFLAADGDNEPSAIIKLAAEFIRDYGCTCRDNYAVERFGIVPTLCTVTYAERKIGVAKGIERFSCPI